MNDYRNQSRISPDPVSVFDEYGPPPVHIDGQLELGEDEAPGDETRELRPPSRQLSGRSILTVREVVAQRLKNIH